MRLTNKLMKIFLSQSPIPNPQSPVTSPQSQIPMVFQCTNALITIATLDVKELVFFYTQFFQKQPEYLIPKTYAEFQLPGMKLAIFKPKSTQLSEFQISASSKMSLCLEVNDLECTIAHLTSLGHPPPGEIMIASHGREIYAYDPDNNRIILYESTYT